MTNQNLLIEIGCEELPAKLQPVLAESFKNQFDELLSAHNIPRQGPIRWYVSPRHLALFVEGLQTAQAAKTVELWGPPAAVAVDASGQPSKAGLAFAEKCGLPFERLEQRFDGKIVKLFGVKEEPSKPTAQLLPELIAKALAGLPIPKPMRWGASAAQFIRPVHWAVVLFGEQVIDCELLGLRAGRITRGHRFHAPQAIELAQADDYLAALEQARVIVEFERRRELIRAAVQAEGPKHGGVAVIDESLLEEVTGLVEWPVALTGRFDEQFLAVPSEALVATMKDNQKYFHVVNAQGKLLPYFITIANIESTEPASVISGNEKVVRPRLTDAKFFFETDCKQRLDARWGQLEKVVFQTQLGSTAEKCTRVGELAAFIAQQIGVDAELTRRAAKLSKCDLMSLMVGEFPELQGIMGMHYARHDGEGEEIALSLNEQYLPRFAGDSLPSGKIGMALALADKMDTLVGIFGINQAPTGDKDPFALRRAAIGLLRIIVEKQLPLDLLTLIEQAQSHYRNPELMAHPPKFIDAQTLSSQVLDFLLNRFRAAYADAGIATDVFQAVLARRPTAPVDFDARIKAVAYFRALPEAEALAAANKRVANILAKAEGDYSGAVNQTLLGDPAEQTLAEAVSAMEAELAPVFAEHRYQDALARLASLRAPVDNFFDKVMVMAEDEAVRSNRLTLLSRLRGLFLGVADISVLQ